MAINKLQILGDNKSIFQLSVCCLFTNIRTSSIGKKKAGSFCVEKEEIRTAVVYANINVDDILVTDSFVLLIVEKF